MKEKKRERERKSESMSKDTPVEEHPKTRDSNNRRPKREIGRGRERTTEDIKKRNEQNRIQDERNRIVRSLA